MAVLPQDRRGQLELVFTIVAVAAVYFMYSGTPVLNWAGITQLNHVRDSLTRQIDSLNNQVDNAKRVVRQGTVAQLERRLAEYRASLDMMRQLVPAGEEIPNLLDDITSRAKVRGARIDNFVPANLESGAPFDTKRARVLVTGQYDQIGEFLSDISSLPRIIVPYDIRISRMAGPTADTARVRAGTLLQASFQIRTYVKPQPADTTQQRPRPRPAAPPAAGRRS
jgi:type IV pilus assembly protein PilO